MWILMLRRLTGEGLSTLNPNINALDRKGFVHHGSTLALTPAQGPVVIRLGLGFLGHRDEDLGLFDKAV